MGAVGLAGITTAAAVPDEPVAEAGPVLARDEAHQVEFDFFRGSVFGEAEPPGKPLDMGVDDDAFGGVEGVAEDDICGFAAYAGEFGEGIEGAWDLAGVVVEEGDCGQFEVACLGPEKPGGLHQRLEFVLGDGGVVLRGAAAEKEAACDLVDTHVGALGRKDGGHEQLERVGEIQLAVGVGVGAGEKVEQLGGTKGKGGAGHACEYCRRTGGRKKAGVRREIGGRRSVCLESPWVGNLVLNRGEDRV